MPKGTPEPLSPKEYAGILRQNIQFLQERITKNRQHISEIGNATAGGVIGPDNQIAAYLTRIRDDESLLHMFGSDLARITSPMPHHLEQGDRCPDAFWNALDRMTTILTKIEVTNDKDIY